jgi:hypothetical protein
MRNVFLYAVLFFVVAGFVHSDDEPELFSFDQSFFAYFNKTKTTPKDGNIEAFIAAMYEDEYRVHWRNNEFEKRKLLQKADPQIKDGIAKFNSSTLYAIGGKYRIDDYDFKKEGFPMDSYPSYDSVTLGRASYEDRINFLLVFPNIDNFNFLKMDPEKAEAFLSSRTDWSGSPVRDIILIFVFKVGDNDKRFTDYIKSKKYFEFCFINGVIQRVEVWDPINSVKIGELVK